MNTYTISFTDNRLIATYENFEFALLAARQLSHAMTGEQIVLRSRFFTYIYLNGIEV